MQDPDSKRRALLIQTDMDVDSDGSDADRLNDIDASDPNYQVLTSYKWPKRSPVVNALIKPRQDRLARLESDLKGNLSAARRKELTAAAEPLRNDIYQLEHYSSLIGKTTRSSSCPASWRGKTVIPTSRSWAITPWLSRATNYTPPSSRHRPEL